MKINPRHYILIVFAILSILATGFAYFFIYQKAISQADQYVQVNKEIENEDTKKHNDQDLIKIYNSTKDSREKILTYLVKEDKVVNFIETLEKVGTDSNTKLELSSINNDSGIIKVNVSVKGSWSNVMTSLVLVENLPLSLYIKDVKLNSVSDLEKKGRSWELTFSAEAISIK